MWARISSCFRRHRRKLFILGGVIGGFALLNTYFKRKFVEWESKKALEYLEQMKRASHFEGTMHTCDSALISFTPKIRELVCSAVDVNPVVERLKLNPPNKVELWECLKVQVFTQAFGEMYAQCLLVVLLRIQISILGGYNYARVQSDGQPDSKTTENQTKYLSRITSFFVGGIKDLMIPVEKAVHDVLQPISLDHVIKLADFGGILSAIKMNVSQGTLDTIPNITQYLMSADCIDANQNEDGTCDEFMENILRETRDVLECKDFSRVLMLSVEHGTAALMDRISECYVFLSNDESKFMNPHNLAVPLARIIPMMHNVFSQHDPNEPGALIHTLLQQDSLKTFAANIYEAFSQHST